MKSSPKIAALVAIAVICVFAFFVGLGSYPLLDPGDGYFAEASREMLRRGEFVVPYLNGQIYFSKPIMIYWLIMSAYSVAGISEFAARLPSAMLATLSVLLTFLMAQRLRGTRAAFLAAVVLASSPLFCTFGRMCLVDMTFTAWLTAALAATVFTLGRHSRHHWILIYVALAGAVLTKGPAALLLFGGALGLFALVRRENLRTFLLTELKVVQGFGILCVLVLPWFIAVGLATDWLWPKVFLLFENMDRFHGQTNHRNLNPFFYLWVLAYGLLPWSITLPAIAGRLKEQLLDNRLMCLLLCWAIAVVGMFTLSSTKLQTYILPAFPAIAVLFGLGMDSWLAAFESRRVRHMPRSFSAASVVLGIVGVLAVVVSAVVAIGLACNRSFFPDPGFSVETKAFTSGILFVVGGVCLAQLWLLKRAARPAWMKGFILANCACVVLSASIAFELSYAYSQADLHSAIEPLMSTRWADSDVAIFAHFKPSVMFYLHHSVDSFFHPDALAQLDPNSKFTQYVLATDKQAPLLLAQVGDKLQLVKATGHWMLFRSDSLKLRKLPTLASTFKSGISLSTGKYHWGTLPFAGAGNIQ